MTEESTPSQLASADTDADGDESGGGTETTAAADSSLDPTGDVVSCTRLDEETLEFELVNSSTEASNYWLTVGFYDDAGQRVADTSVFFNYVRPGERAIEQSYVFEAEGSTCEVLEIDRTSADIDDEALADASACEISGEDFVGDVTATLSVTNSTSEVNDYIVTTALVDADGVRRGTGDAWIEAVQPSETAPSDVFTTVDFDSDLTCEVVAVEPSAP